MKQAPHAGKEFVPSTQKLVSADWIYQQWLAPAPGVKLDEEHADAHSKHISDKDCFLHAHLWHFKNSVSI